MSPRVSRTLPAVQPILLTPRGAPFDDPAWLFEPKYDGYRGLLSVTRKGCHFRSKRGNILKRFEELCHWVLEELPVKEAILDGEVVALDSEGRQNFRDLRAGRGSPAECRRDRCGTRLSCDTPRTASRSRQTATIPRRRRSRCTGDRNRHPPLGLEPTAPVAELSEKAISPAVGHRGCGPALDPMVHSMTYVTASREVRSAGRLGCSVRGPDWASGTGGGGHRAGVTLARRCQAAIKADRNLEVPLVSVGMRVSRPQPWSGPRSAAQRRTCTIDGERRQSPPHPFPRPTALARLRTDWEIALPPILTTDPGSG